MADKRTYSEEIRAEAISRYVNDGVGAASKALEIPQGTIAAWAARTPGVHKATAEKRGMNAALLEERRQTWEARRLDLQEQFAGLADTMLAAAFDLAEDERWRDAKDAITSAAIATDKANLLAGGNTSRVAIEVESHEAVKHAKARVMELMPNRQAS
jgi:transposase-like protein